MRIPYACIGTKRGQNFGIVYRPGRFGTVVIGRVKRDSKDAAGTYGPGGPSKRTFFTAEVWNGLHLSTGPRRLPVPSLGTRHPSRAHAVRAIRLFWEWWANDPSNAGRHVVPTGYDVQRFKYEHRAVCALDSSPMARVQRPDSAYPRGAAYA